MNGKFKRARVVAKNFYEAADTALAEARLTDPDAELQSVYGIENAFLWLD